MKKLVSIILLFISLHAIAGRVNLIDPLCFGFEETNSTWWIQHSDYWSISTAEAYSGSQSIKFSTTNSSAVTESKKAHSSDLSSTINLSPGTYTLKMKVFIEASYTGTGFNNVIKETWLSTKVDFSGLEKGKWIDIEKEITVSETIANSRMMLSVSAAQAGNGAFYIDDIFILEEIADDTPLTSKIVTSGSSNLTLDAHYYDAKLKVWVENNNNIDVFYTIIQEPYTALKWNIASIARETWVELQQSFQLKEDVNNSIFEIKVPNNVEYGGGSGTFYIDDISFIGSEGTAITESKESGIRVYPNPAKSTVNIEAPLGSQLYVYDMLGKCVLSQQANNDISQISVAGLKKGIYIIQVRSENTNAKELLIVE